MKSEKDHRVIIIPASAKGAPSDQSSLESSTPGPGFIPPPSRRPSCLACMQSKVKCDRDVPVSMVVEVYLRNQEVSLKIILPPCLPSIPSDLTPAVSLT